MVDISIAKTIEMVLRRPRGRDEAMLRIRKAVYCRAEHLSEIVVHQDPVRTPVDTCIFLSLLKSSFAKSALLCCDFIHQLVEGVNIMWVELTWQSQFIMLEVFMTCHFVGVYVEYIATLTATMVATGAKD